MNQLTGRILLSGSLPSTTNIQYLSGFTAPDPFLYLYTDRCSILLVSPMEKGRAEKQAKADTEAVTPGDLGLKGKKSRDRVAQITALMEKAGIRRLEVPYDFPAGTFLALQRKGIRISVHKGEMCPQRAVKNGAELKLIAGSQKAAVKAMKAAVAMIGGAEIGKSARLMLNGKPLTSERVRKLIHKTLIDQECNGQETIVAGGEQAADPHERGHGQLYAGQAVILDIFPKNEKTGYWGDITRTVCRGPASPELKKLYNAVRASQTAALRAVKPGICADEIHHTAAAVFSKRGYETKLVDGVNIGFIHGTGHGVGLDIHEQPRISAGGAILQPGNVITIEPGLYYPGLGGVRIEDTVAVTEEGYRFLAHCPKKFELL